jgi:hypothetical protein
VLVAPLSSASPQEEKQGLQKDVPSEGSGIKSTLNQDEWEIKTIPINTFWIKKKKRKGRSSHFLPSQNVVPLGWVLLATIGNSHHAPTLVPIHTHRREACSGLSQP